MSFMSACLIEITQIIQYHAFTHSAELPIYPGKACDPAHIALSIFSHSTLEGLVEAKRLVDHLLFTVRTSTLTPYFS